MAKEVLNKNRQKSTHSAELSQSQMAAVVALTAGCSITDAASRAGIDRSTIYLWLKQAAFVAELNRAKTLFITDSVDELKSS